MASIERLMQVLDKANTGPVTNLNDWGLAVGKNIQEKLAKYKIANTCDLKNPINIHDDLADAFFKAGYELAVDMGLFCQDTERVIRLSESDFAYAIKNTKDNLILGKGRDRVVLKHRQPEDPHEPINAAPMGHLVTEELYVKLTQGIARHREVDLLRSPTPGTMHGRPVLAGTPMETAAGMYQMQLSREARWKAGRPGMPDLCVASSTTEYGNLGAFGAPGGADPDLDVALILAPGELTTSFEVLHKVIHAINCGAKLTNGFSSMIGGFPGPPEGAAMARIATILQQTAYHQTDFFCGSIFDVRYLGNCGPHGQWAESISTQAISRNTHINGTEVQNQLAGPCTKMLMYESAVCMINLAASGAAGYLGPRTSGTKYANHITPLDCKWCGEVLKAAAGMTRKKANEIVNQLIPRYEDKLKNPDIGQAFEDCYDIDTLTPTQELQDLYLSVKQELIDMGLPLDMLV
jgi:methylamine--corrinoid protein Co-methyltransferase